MRACESRQIDRWSKRGRKYKHVCFIIANLISEPSSHTRLAAKTDKIEGGGRFWRIDSESRWQLSHIAFAFRLCSRRIILPYTKVKVNDYMYFRWYFRLLPISLDYNFNSSIFTFRKATVMLWATYGRSSIFHTNDMRIISWNTIAMIYQWFLYA